MKKLTAPYRYKLPLIIKEALGEDLYNQMQKIVDEAPPRREWVIYSSSNTIDAIEKAIDEELKHLIQ